MPAPDLTTAEICRELKRREVAAGVPERVRCILSDSDLVKFAKWVPELSLGRDRLEQVREVVLLCPVPTDEETCFTRSNF